MGDVWRAHEAEQRQEDDAFELAPIATLSAALSAVSDVGGLEPALMNDAVDHEARQDGAFDQYTAAAVAAAASAARDERWTDYIGEDNRQGWAQGFQDHASDAAAAAAVAAVGFSHADLEAAASHDQFGTHHEGAVAEELPQTTEQPSDEALADPSDQPTGSKRKRKPAKKTEPAINWAETEVEYSHPSRDPKLGPVFLHPPKDAAQACMRCHRIKRKCDATRPRCKGCEKADEVCMFELSSATSGFVHELKATNTELSSQIAAAHERIQHLELALASMQQPARQVAEDQRPFAAATHEAAAKQHFNGNDTSVDVLHALLATEDASSAHVASNALDRTSAYPTHTAIQSAAEAYQETFGDVYTVFQPGELDRLIAEVYADGGLTSSVSPRQHFLVLVAAALGLACSPQLASEDFSTSSVKAIAMRHIAQVVAIPDLLCVQGLTLLALLEMYQPSGAAVWNTVGLACRVAVTAGLHRHESGDPDPSEQQNASPRHAVFRALYNLDRLVAYTLRRPVSIPDEFINSVRTTHNPADRGLDPTPAGTSLFVSAVRRISNRIVATLTFAKSPPVEPHNVEGFETHLRELWNAIPDARGHRTFAVLSNELRMAAMLWHSPTLRQPEPTEKSVQELHESASEYLTIWETNFSGSTNIVDGSHLMFSACCLFFAFTSLVSNGTPLAVEQIPRVIVLVEREGGPVPLGSRLRQAYNRMVTAAQIAVDITNGSSVKIEDMAELTRVMVDLNQSIAEGLFVPSDSDSLVQY